MHSKIAKLIEAANVLDSIGEVALANEVDALLQKYAVTDDYLTGRLPASKTSPTTKPTDQAKPASPATNSGVAAPATGATATKSQPNAANKNTKKKSHKDEMLEVQKLVNEILKLKGVMENKDYSSRMVKVNGYEGDANTWGQVSFLGFQVKKDFSNYQQLLAKLKALSETWKRSVDAQLKYSQKTFQALQAHINYYFKLKAFNLDSDTLQVELEQNGNPKDQKTWATLKSEFGIEPDPNIDYNQVINIVIRSIQAMEAKKKKTEERKKLIQEVSKGPQTPAKIPGLRPEKTPSKDWKPPPRRF